MSRPAIQKIHTTIPGLSKDNNTMPTTSCCRIASMIWVGDHAKRQMAEHRVFSYDSILDFVFGILSPSCVSVKTKIRKPFFPKIRVFRRGGIVEELATEVVGTEPFL